MGGGGASEVLKNNAVGATKVFAYTRPCIITAIRTFQNGLAADAYLQLFDSPDGVGITIGTTKPDWVVLNDFGSGAVSVGDGLPNNGLVFKTGITIVSTTGPSDAVANTQDVRIAIR